MYCKSFPAGPPIHGAGDVPSIEGAEFMSDIECKMWYDMLWVFKSESGFTLFDENFYCWIEKNYKVVYVRDGIQRLLGIAAEDASVTLVHLKYLRAK